jgi:hypothetical protein
MFSLQNRYAFVQSLKPDKDNAVPAVTVKKPPKGSEKLPSFLRGLKGASKETTVHDTNAKTEDDKKKEAVKKVKRKKEDYIRFEV